jgi:hypothetical protein
MRFEVFISSYKIINGINNRKGAPKMPRNTLRDGNQPLEQINGDSFINTERKDIVTINGQELIREESVTKPDENGNYVDTQKTHLLWDYAGNPLPEDPQLTIRSWTGLYIPSEDKRALCTSFFHSNRYSRNIYIGQDGRLTPRGAICSRCDYWLTTIYIAIGIVGIGVILGLFKAVSSL